MDSAVCLVNSKPGQPSLSQNKGWFLKPHPVGSNQKKGSVQADPRPCQKPGILLLNPVGLKQLSKVVLKPD